MASQTATADGNAVITETDFDRLRHLLDSPRYAQRAALLRSLKDELDRAKSSPPGTCRGASSPCTRSCGCGTSSTVNPTTTRSFTPRRRRSARGSSPSWRRSAGRSWHRPGQVIEFEAPGGLRRLKVVKVLYQPEAAGDFHL